MYKYRITGISRDYGERASFEIDAATEREAIKEAAKLAPKYVTECKLLKPLMTEQPVPANLSSFKPHPDFKAALVNKPLSPGNSIRFILFGFFLVMFLAGAGVIALGYNQDEYDKARWTSERAITSLQSNYRAYQENTDPDAAEQKAFRAAGLEVFEPSMGMKIVGAALMSFAALFFLGTAVLIATRNKPQAP